jgi:hypothetical protein
MPDGEAFHLRTTDRPATVRMATAADEEPLFDLLFEMYGENAIGGHPVSRDKVMAAIRKGTRQQGTFIGVIDGPDGRPAASMALELTDYWYSDDWFLHERWLFVRGDSRHSRYDEALFRWADGIRRDMGQRTGQRWEIVMAFWTPARLAAKLRLWGRYARQVGGVFIMDGDR